MTAPASTSSPPVARMLASGLVRKFRIDADLALALIGELADRFDLAVACWDRDDVSAHLDHPRDLTDAEYARVRRTLSWPQVASAAAGSRHDIADVMREVIAQAALECACCTGPVHGEPVSTLGHCDRCRATLGTSVIRSRGCPAMGFARHHPGQLKDPHSPDLQCLDCDQLLAWGNDPGCGVCHGTGGVGSAGGRCPCGRLLLRIAATVMGLGAC